MGTVSSARQAKRERSERVLAEASSTTEEQSPTARVAAQQDAIARSAAPFAEPAAGPTNSGSGAGVGDGSRSSHGERKTIERRPAGDVVATKMVCPTHARRALAVDVIQKTRTTSCWTWFNHPQIQFPFILQHALAPCSRSREKHYTSTAKNLLVSIAASFVPPELGNLAALTFLELQGNQLAVSHYAHVCGVSREIFPDESQPRFWNDPCSRRCVRHHSTSTKVISNTMQEAEADTRLRGNSSRTENCRLLDHFLPADRRTDEFPTQLSSTTRCFPQA